jgi:hypothetical protein
MPAQARMEGEPDLSLTKVQLYPVMFRKRNGRVLRAEAQRRGQSGGVSAVPDPTERVT